MDIYETFHAWKQFLTENLSSQEQHHFGEKFQKFYEQTKKLTDAKQIRQVAEQLFTQIGAGSFRVVYAIDEEYVLKIAFNADGCRMNLEESNNPMQTRYADILPQYGPTDPNGRWTVVERALPGYNEMQIAKAFHEIYVILNKYCKKSSNQNPNTYDAYKKSIHLPKADVVNFYYDMLNFSHERAAGESMVQSMQEAIEGILEFTMRETFIPSEYIRKQAAAEIVKTYPLRRILQMVDEFDVDMYDLSIRNMGWVRREGKHVFVLIDINKIQTKLRPWSS